MKTTRQEFFEAEDIDVKDVYEKIYSSVGNKPNYETFIGGDIRNTIQIPGREIQDFCLLDTQEKVPYGFRIGADLTPVSYRHYVPIEEKERKMTLSQMIEKYVVQFDIEAFAEKFELSEMEKEEIRTKLSGVQQKLKSGSRLSFEVPNSGRTNIDPETPVVQCMSYKIGVLKDEYNVVITDEDGDMIFEEENIIDIVIKEINKGGD